MLDIGLIDKIWQYFIEGRRLAKFKPHLFRASREELRALEKLSQGNTNMTEDSTDKFGFLEAPMIDIAIVLSSVGVISFVIGLLIGYWIWG